MDPIQGVLDERFFIIADSTCLTALAKLVDDALALRLQAFLDTASSENQAAAVIKEYLGDAIKVATFHLLLLERGSCQIVEKIELETIAGMRFDQSAVISELEFIQENIQFVRTYIEPRKKTDFDVFFASLPVEYRSKVAANKIMFFQPRAHARSTGVGIIIRKKDIWTIALKGLKFREYFARAGYAMDGYMLKEF